MMEVLYFIFPMIKYYNVSISVNCIELLIYCALLDHDNVMVDRENSKIKNMMMVYFCRKVILDTIIIRIVYVMSCEKIKCHES